ncbi:MAG: (d)CMP kinase [Oscillospiraceae bacterium]|nr:(d)CMP kinase [Oscillospiraceae bacterium]
MPQSNPITDMLEAIQAYRNASKPVFIALDGRSAAGKSTLAAQLARQIHCLVLHMDDFYLPLANRTAEQMAQPGGHMDYPRLLQEVLLPLHEKQCCSYSAFDCKQQILLPPISLFAAPIILLEGSYSCHPLLWEQADLHCFLDITPQQQAERLAMRDRQSAAQFHSVWIPREEQYFSAYDIRQRCDRILYGTNP